MQASIWEVAGRWKSFKKKSLNLCDKADQDKVDGTKDKIKQRKIEKTSSKSTHSNHKLNDSTARRSDRWTLKRKEINWKKLEWEDPSHIKWTVSKKGRVRKKIIDSQRKIKGIETELNQNKRIEKIDSAPYQWNLSKETPKKWRAWHEGIPTSKKYQTSWKMIFWKIEDESQKKLMDYCFFISNCYFRVGIILFNRW